MSATPPGSEPPLRLGRFELRPREYRLLADGEPVALGGRAMDLLLLLAARAGELVTRNELIEHAWPGRVVEDNNLSVQIKALRKALGDEWLVTVPGRGYRLDLNRPAAEARAPPSATTQRPRLPLLLQPLIGREADLLALHALLARHRLVSIVGAGGIGKTRLAQAVLHARAGQHADGVCWVELGSVASAETLPVAVAAALGLPLGPGDPLRQLTRALGGLQMLLALDNAEHLLAPVAALTQTLVEACGGLQLLVTSQAPLKLAAEHVMRLGPLAVPPTTLPANEAQGFGAVALFCDRAAAADHRFVLRDADVAAVVGLCQSLDGLPLAIELAAARAAALGIPALREALSGRLQLLGAHPDRQAPPRQRSVRAALEWSVGLMSPAARALFCCLGVVVGSASLALVQRLGVEQPDGWEVVDALDELIQRSLVDVVHSETYPQTRYRLLELPRLLALEMLAARGEEDTVRLRHAHAVLAEFETVRAALHGGLIGRRAGEHLREPDMGNARQALAYAARRGDRLLELALAGASMLGAGSAERLAMADRCIALMAQPMAEAPLDPLLEFNVQRAIGTALLHFRPAQSLQAKRRALALARQVDAQQVDRFPLYLALCDLAGSLTHEAGRQECENLLREASTLEDASWPALRKQFLLRMRANLALNQGDASVALALNRQLLQVELEAGETGYVTRANLASTELVVGDATASVASGELLVAELAGWRHESLLVHASANLILAHLALDEPSPARALAEQRWGGTKPAPLHAWFIDALALLAAMEGRFPAAGKLAGAADARYQAAGVEREIVEQRAYERTLALLAEAGVPVHGPAADALNDAGLIALALARG